MQFGYLTGNHAGGLLPGDLGRELEERGFTSMWVPEHSHIPTSRRTPYPNGGPLPDSYLHMMDPFVSIMAAAAATTSLQLCTGICLVLEHDVLDLACTVATADVLSGGRLRLGIGVGWNVEKLENHRPDLEFRQRYRAMEERVAAMRLLWGNESAAFDGTWDRFSDSWVYPKPLTGTVPIALGNAGPLGIEHAARYGDEWCPIDASVMNVDGRPDIIGGIDRFRRLASEAGRDADAIPISLFLFRRPTVEQVEQYAAAGVTQCVVTPVHFNMPSPDETLRHLDELAPILEATA